MTFKAYLDNVKAKTGKTAEDFRVLAKEKGLVKYAEVIDWLKTDFGLGLGHANAIAYVILHGDEPRSTPEERIAKLFGRGRGHWRKSYDALFARVSRFGNDIEASPTQSYISLLHHEKKFAIVQPTSEHLDIGIKLKGTPPAGRLEASGTWNSMVTHRVQVRDPKEIDSEIVGWLKQAFEMT